jgi:hypothetical protein
LERKTGLFIPYWLADRFSDWLEEQKGEKVWFEYAYFQGQAGEIVDV